MQHLNFNDVGEVNAMLGIEEVSERRTIVNDLESG
jgi:hypothetical protein